MAQENWMEHPALKNMDSRKKAILKEIMEESKGKPMNQSLPILLNAQAKLKAQSLSFTQEESTTIMLLLTQNLSPEDHEKVERMRTFMSMKR